MNKLLTLFLLIALLAFSMAGNFRNLGKMYSSSSSSWSSGNTGATAVVTVTPETGENVAVVVEEAHENVGENVPKDLGTTTTTKVYSLPDGTIIKKVIITCHKTCLNGIVTTTTTTETITYNNNTATEHQTEVEVAHEAEQTNTVTVEGGTGENVVVVVPEAEENNEYPMEVECETVTEHVTVTPETGENIVVHVEAAEEAQTEAVVKDLGTTVTTKTYRTQDGTIVKIVIITVHKTCENGIITTKTTTKTITWTPKAPVVSESGSGENVVVVVPEAENNHEYAMEEDCETVKTTVMEAETPSVGENVVVVVQEQEHNVGEAVPKDLGKTVTTKIYRLTDGTIVKKVIITCQKTCLNGIVTTTTTTETITYNNNAVTEHQTEMEVAHEAENNVVTVPVESSQNVVVVVHEGEESGMKPSWGKKW